MRDGGSAALATPRSASEPRHLGRSACLIDEDQLGGIEIELAIKPGLPGFENIVALLLRPRGGCGWGRAGGLIEVG